MFIRLDKYISDAAQVSRQDAKKFLSKGMVAVDGKIVKKGDAKVDDAVNVVTVNGKPLQYKQFVYIMLNKPKGVVSATDDKIPISLMHHKPLYFLPIYLLCTTETASMGKNKSFKCSQVLSFTAETKAAKGFSPLHS